MRRSSASATRKGIVHCRSLSSVIRSGGGCSTSCGSASSLSKTWSWPTGIACSTPRATSVMSARQVPVAVSVGVAVKTPGLSGAAISTSTRAPPGPRSSSVRLPSRTGCHSSSQVRWIAQGSLATPCTCGGYSTKSSSSSVQWVTTPPPAWLWSSSAAMSGAGPAHPGSVRNSGAEMAARTRRARRIVDLAGTCTLRLRSVELRNHSALGPAV